MQAFCIVDSSDFVHNHLLWVQILFSFHLSSTLLKHLSPLWWLNLAKFCKFIALLICANSLLNLTTLQVDVLFLYEFRTCNILRKKKSSNTGISHCTVSYAFTQREEDRHNLTQLSIFLKFSDQLYIDICKLPD